MAEVANLATARAEGERPHGAPREGGGHSLRGVAPPSELRRRRRRGLEELRKSIEEVGVLVPLVVRPLGKKEYAVIAGAGRLEALRANGASASSHVPCIVVDVDDAKATLLSLVENAVREAMTPLEEAEVARTLVEEYGYQQRQVADAIGRTQSLVSKWLSVFRLDRSVVAALRDGAIGMSTVRSARYASAIAALAPAVSLSVEMALAPIPSSYSLLPVATTLPPPELRGPRRRGTL